VIGPEATPESQVRGEGKFRSGQRKRNPAPPIPAEVRKEITQAARLLNRNHHDLFIADPKLKDRVARLLRSLLPPKPRRRGRPGREDVTTAILLLVRFRRMHPTERPELLWRRVYPLAIPNYETMSDIEQLNARQQLRERVKWRRRGRNRVPPGNKSPGAPRT
jgi:hypothetical protein